MLLFAQTPADFGINNIAAFVSIGVLLYLSAMFRFLGLCFGTLLRLLRSRQRLLIENLVLRQQLVVLKQRQPRPRLDWLDKLFWLLLRRCWSGWKQALLVVTPETVVRWHRAGFRWYWKLISKVNPVNANRGCRPVQFAYGIRMVARK